MSLTDTRLINDLVDRMNNTDRRLNGLESNDLFDLSGSIQTESLQVSGSPNTATAATGFVPFATPLKVTITPATTRVMAILQAVLAVPSGVGMVSLFVGDTNQGNATHGMIKTGSTTGLPYTVVQIIDVERGVENTVEVRGSGTGGSVSMVANMLHILRIIEF
jgi:hypothetical protein